MGGNEGRRCMARKGTLRQSQIQGTRGLGRVSISIVDNNQIETLLEDRTTINRNLPNPFWILKVFDKMMTTFYNGKV